MSNLPPWAVEKARELIPRGCIDTKIELPMQMRIAQALVDEREECAKVAERFYKTPYECQDCGEFTESLTSYPVIARAIRQRQ